MQKLMQKGWMCLMVADASDQHTSQHTWPLVTTQAFSTVIVTVDLSIQSYIGIVSLHLALQTLS